MTDLSVRVKVRCILVSILIAGICPATLAAPEYVNADVKISGNEIHAFEDGGENVTVVVGSFRLTMGQRRITGRDAVLWVKTDPGEKIDRNDITVYVEGSARVSEPGGATLTDRDMIVTVRNAGRLSASGVLSERPLKGFPLFERAKAARKEWAMRSTPRGRVTRSAPPQLVLAEAPRDVPAERSAPAPRSVTTREQPAPSGAPREGETRPADRIVHPVNFHADKVTHQIMDKRWVTVARGNVYLSQGHPDSDLFMEMRAQAGVVFTEKGVEDISDTRVPYAPRLRGLRGTDLVITGVYLEGDVVISRGERYFRGPEAFYDFTTRRAIVIDPVFRTIQEQRNIPIYIRAREARALSARELWFADAKVSTSDFYTPSYHVGSSTAYLMDTTPYDEEGERLGERSWRARLQNATFNIRGFPILWTPLVQGDLTEGNSAIRKVQVGRSGRFGWGVETEWHLFRLLGLVRPEGYKGRLGLEWRERGLLGGPRISYSRKDYTGYHLLYGVLDDDREDDFGSERDGIDAPRQRGRLLMRHKQFLPNDWQLQFELSYICDRNFLEQFFPGEFYAGKEQETIFYAKKQTDNWAFTSLVKNRLNRFQSQGESVPDLGLYLIGEPLMGDRLTFFHESHAGIKRYKWDRALANRDNSSYLVRVDTRDEVSLPMRFGPINIVPYAVGRATYWGDDIDQQAIPETTAEQCRVYGQAAVKASTDIWAVYDNVDSRLWDVHKLKHVITPEVTGWIASSHGIYPEDLYPFDPDIEEHLDRTSGMAVNLYQRLQTKRGAEGDRQTVDWMRLNLSLGVYDNHRDTVPSDGRFFAYRPEYSLGRNHLNAEYFWNISDSTLLLADANYDLDDQRLGRGNIGLAVQRDPRLRYYAGMRYTDDLDSAVGTFGINYKINRKYSISAFEQYDFAFRDGRNLATAVTITRKLPRWYAAFTFAYETTDNEVTLLISFWPEGIEEVRLGSGKLAILGRSEEN